MKILFLSNVGSGLKIFRGELIECLLSEGHHVYASFPADNYCSQLERIGCTCINTTLNRRGMNPVEDIKLLYEYCKLLKKMQPDVVLTYTIKPNLYGGLACRLLGIPQLANITGLGDGIERGGWLQKVLLILYKVALKKARVVFCQNEEVLSFLQKKKIAFNCCKLLPGSGVNLQQFQFTAYPPVNDGVHLIFVGRLLKAKGSAEIFRAAEIIRSRYSNVTFTSIGDCETDFEKEVESLNASGAVTIVSAKQNIIPDMQSCHALINAAYYEGMSNVMLEAGAIGRPLLASNVAGHTEILEDGINGITFLPHDVDSLVQAIEKFLNLPYERKKEMGIASRMKIEATFDRNLVISAYLKEIECIYEKGVH